MQQDTISSETVNQACDNKKKEALTASQSKKQNTTHITASPISLTTKHNDADTPKKLDTHPNGHKIAKQQRSKHYSNHPSRTTHSHTVTKTETQTHVCKTCQSAHQTIMRQEVKSEHTISTTVKTHRRDPGSGRPSWCPSKQGACLAKALTPGMRGARESPWR